MKRACLGPGSYPERCPFGGVTDRGSRCPGCTREHQRRRDLERGSAAQRGYGADWRKVRATILARDSHSCFWCGGPATSVDHVVPKARGGSDDPDNLVASCGRCNSARGGQLNRRG